MVKKQPDYLDVEAMKFGYQLMLDEVNVQLKDGSHTESIRAVFIDRKNHIEARLEELTNG